MYLRSNLDDSLARLGGGWQCGHSILDPSWTGYDRVVLMQRLNVYVNIVNLLLFVEVVKFAGMSPCAVW